MLSWSSFVKGDVPKEFVDLEEIHGIQIDLRYASENNFTGENLYGSFRKAFLHDVAFQKLKKASQFLQKKNPEFQFLILDALRPKSVQKVLFSKVKGTPQEIYVADPEKGSVHNYGFAVDLTLADKQGNEVDMGTPFDDFTEMAQPRFEKKFLQEKRLTARRLENRRILRAAMEFGGFKPILHEWWHFNALDIAEIKQTYTVVE